MGDVHRFAGSCKARQEVGDPGHCEACVTDGHLVAHPDLGCGDVGCDANHEEAGPRVYLSVLVLIDRGDGTPEERLVDESAYHGGSLVDALGGAYEALESAGRKVDKRMEAESDAELRAHVHEADDGTRWTYSEGLAIWTGWVPGEDGNWVLEPAEFERQYPEIAAKEKGPSGG